MKIVHCLSLIKSGSLLCMCLYMYAYNYLLSISCTFITRMEFVLQFHDANGHVIQIACRVVSFSLLYVLSLAFNCICTYTYT